MSNNNSLLASNAALTSGSQRKALADLTALAALPYGSLLATGVQSYRVGTVEYWWDSALTSPGPGDVAPADKPAEQPGYWVATGFPGPWRDADSGAPAHQGSGALAFDSGRLRLGAYGQGRFDHPNPVRLLAVDASGTLVEFDSAAAPAAGAEPVFYKAAGSVTAAGQAEQLAGATVRRTATGQYDITFTSPANNAIYPVLATMAALPQNDDYQWAYLNRTVMGFRIEVREQDNGGAPGVPVDSAFSFFVPII